MSKNILAVLTFSVCFFAINYAYADCYGKDCYCTFGVYDKINKGGWVSLCYSPDGRQVGSGSSYSSRGAIENCLERCLHYDAHQARFFLDFPTAKGSSKVIRKDPHESSTVLDKKPKKSVTPMKRER